MTTEGPYTYPLTKRKDIEAWLGEHMLYRPDHSQLYLAWDIKCNFRFDASGAKYRTEFKFEERFDEAWDQALRTHPEMFDRVCEDATRMYTEGEWTRYPGVEQGSYKFSIAGRSGGWMLLEDVGYPLSWCSLAEYQDWLQELSWAELRKFYKVIVQLDHDLSREACREEMEYQYAWRRSLWEEDQLEAEERAARKLEASRPDMYTEVKGDE